MTGKNWTFEEMLIPISRNSGETVVIDKGQVFTAPKQQYQWEPRVSFFTSAEKTLKSYQKGIESTNFQILAFNILVWGSFLLKVQVLFSLITNWQSWKQINKAIGSVRTKWHNFRLLSKFHVGLPGDF